MKKHRVLSLLAVLCAFSLQPTPAIAIVGYINRTIYPGDNLIANQLIATPDNTLNSVLLGVPVGATFTKWNSAGNAFLPLSSFDGSSWSVNYTLNLGEGGLLNSPGSSVNTFVGEIGPYLNELGPPYVVGWNPGYADGVHLISCPIPIGGASFMDVVGRAPAVGEWVRTLDEATQVYSMTTYDGSSWDNGDPSLAVGQAAWFNLGPVPEPTSLSLLGMAGLLALVRRRHN